MIAQNASEAQAGQRIGRLAGKARNEMTRLRLEAEGSLPSELELEDPNPLSLKLDGSSSRLVAFVAGLAIQGEIPEFGNITLNIADGELRSYEITKTGRIPPPRQAGGVVLKAVK